MKTVSSGLLSASYCWSLNRDFAKSRSVKTKLVTGSSWAWNELQVIHVKTENSKQHCHLGEYIKNTNVNTFLLRFSLLPSRDGLTDWLTHRKTLHRNQTYAVIAGFFPLSQRPLTQQLGWVNSSNSHVTWKNQMAPVLLYRLREPWRYTGQKLLRVTSAHRMSAFQA